MNQKVKHAEVTQSSGISFKSKLEARSFTLLKEAGLDPEYELDKIVLQESYYPTVKFYNNKSGVPNMKKVLQITYTPDFLVRAGNNNHYIETKGFRTDSYAIKVKLFRRWLEENDPTASFYEVNTLTHLKQVIKLIQNDKQAIIPRNNQTSSGEEVADNRED